MPETPHSLQSDFLKPNGHPTHKPSRSEARNSAASPVRERPTTSDIERNIYNGRYPNPSDVPTVPAPYQGYPQPSAPPMPEAGTVDSLAAAIQEAGDSFDALKISNSERHKRNQPTLPLGTNFGYNYGESVIGVNHNAPDMPPPPPPPTSAMPTGAYPMEIPAHITQDPPEGYKHHIPSQGVDPSISSSTNFLAAGKQNPDGEIYPSITYRTLAKGMNTADRGQVGNLFSDRDEQVIDTVKSSIAFEALDKKKIEKLCKKLFKVQVEFSHKEKLFENNPKILEDCKSNERKDFVDFGEMAESILIYNPKTPIENQTTVIGDFPQLLKKAIQTVAQKQFPKSDPEAPQTLNNTMQVLLNNKELRQFCAQIVAAHGFGLHGSGEWICDK